MALSDYFTDEDLESQLRSQFDYDEMWDVDFKTIFNHIQDIGSVLELRFRGKVFHIDKVTASVTEVKD